MKYQKKIRLGFVISLMTFVLISTNSCFKADEKIILEIKETIVGNAQFTGDILFFRMNQNREVEFDSIRDSEIPLSQSNLVRKKIILSEQDADQIQSILAELEKSGFNKYYTSNKLATDVSYSTNITFAGKNGKNENIVIQGDIGQVPAPTDKQKYPSPLIMLLKKLISIRKVESS